MMDKEPSSPKRSYKTFIFYGVAIAGVVLGLSIVGKLLSPNETQKPVETVVVEPSPTPQQPVEDDSLPRSEQLQMDLEQGYRTLEASFIELNSEVRMGRAQRWLDQARWECNRLGYEQCPSPQHWLRLSYGQYRDKLNELIVRETQVQGGTISNPQLSLDDKAIAEYRQLSSTLLDIAYALQLRPNASSRRVVVNTGEQRFELGEYWQTLGKLDNLGTEGGVSE